MKRFRYILDISSRKYVCPHCNKKTFVRYKDTTTNEYLDQSFGRCDRSDKCQFHNRPETQLTRTHYIENPKPNPPASTHPFSLVDAYSNRYESNQLVTWMAGLPGWTIEVAKEIALQYRLGTGKGKYNEWPIFWQIDHENRVRSGKLIKYNSNGRRSKENYSTDWIHAILKRTKKIDLFELVQCFYGLHLVDGTKPIAIVESEKTAMISSVYLNQFHWLASGSKEGINEFKLRPLIGQKVVLFPDLGAYEKWDQIRVKYSDILNISISDLLERKASDQSKEAGYDLADYLINFDLKQFISSKNKHHAPNGLNPYTGEIFDSRCYPVDWDEVPEPDEGTAEYNEMIRLIESEFDAVIDHSVSPEEIEASWIARDNQTPVKAWND